MGTFQQEAPNDWIKTACLFSAVVSLRGLELRRRREFQGSGFRNRGLSKPFVSKKMDSQNPMPKHVSRNRCPCSLKLHRVWDTLVSKIHTTGLQHFQSTVFSIVFTQNRFWEWSWMTFRKQPSKHEWNWVNLSQIEQTWARFYLIRLNFTQFYSFFHDISSNFTQQFRFRVTTMKNQ